MVIETLDPLLDSDFLRGTVEGWLAFFVSTRKFLDSPLDKELSGVQVPLGCFDSISKFLDPSQDTIEFSRVAVEGRLDCSVSISEFLDSILDTGKIFRVAVEGRLDPFVSFNNLVLLQASYIVLGGLVDPPADRSVPMLLAAHM